MGDTHQPGENVWYLSGKEHQGQVTGNKHAYLGTFYMFYSQ